MAYRGRAGPADHSSGTANANQRIMTTPNMFPNPSGKVGYALLWLLGIPVPILLGIFFLRGCH